MQAPPTSNNNLSLWFIIEICQSRFVLALDVFSIFTHLTTEYGHGWRPEKLNSRDFSNNRNEEQQQRRQQLPQRVVSQGPRAEQRLKLQQSPMTLSERMKMKLSALLKSKTISIMWSKSLKMNDNLPTAWAHRIQPEVTTYFWLNTASQSWT